MNARMVLSIAYMLGSSHLGFTTQELDLVTLDKRLSRVEEALLKLMKAVSDVLKPFNKD